MSNTLLEAMACRCPIVCTNIPENLELVGKDAITIPPKAVKPLADAINRMIDEKSLRKRYADRCYEKVKYNSLSNCVSKLESLYKKMLGE